MSFFFFCIAWIVFLKSLLYIVVIHRIIHYGTDFSECVSDVLKSLRSLHSCCNSTLAISQKWTFQKKASKEDF
jgi:hypothetical protein